MGTISLPLFISGLSLVGVILTNPTSSMLPWLYSTYANIGAMTMMGFCGMDMASLIVYNFLNPHIAETISNKLRIGLYGIQIVCLGGFMISGYANGPLANVIFLEAAACTVLVM